MKKFIQIHMLTPRGCSNVNSDNFGRPKSMKHGNSNRVRISSQCINRTVIRKALEENGVKTSTNTTMLEKLIIEDLTKKVDGKEGIDKKEAKKFAKKIMKSFLKDKTPAEKKDGEKKKDPKEEEDNQEKKSNLLRISNYEFDSIDALVKKIREGHVPKDEDFNVISHVNDMDSSLFGRMNASFPEFNTTAAWTQNHSFCINRSSIEADPFTAVDDLREVGGAGHLNSKYFSDGIFYSYSCCDFDLLVKNIMTGTNKTEEEAKKEATNTLLIILEALATRTPPGKSKKYGDSNSYASYIMIEKGESQPRSFASAFLDPVEGEKQIEQGIDRLKTERERCSTMERETTFIDFNRNEDSKEKFQALFNFLK